MSIKVFVGLYSVIEIINPAIAKSYQDYFDVLRKQEVKIYHAWIESYFGKNPLSTLYQNKNIVAGFKNQFDFLWGIAKE